MQFTTTIRGPEKPPSGRENVKEMTPYYLHKRIQSDSQCLGNMAMKLFERSEQSMNRKNIDYIAEENDQEENLKHEWLALNVTRTSFLHSEAFNNGPAYSFVHQTFQEFFAAQRLVEVSLAGSCIKANSKLCSWIRKHKYNPRFKMVFSFVAGLHETT
ncbi:peptidase C14 [Penicillium sp. CMV-2018d]|nr:peptidase C14 [Penicillium sp. CMV-2018d]